METTAFKVGWNDIMLSLQGKPCGSPATSQQETPISFCRQLQKVGSEPRTVVFGDAGRNAGAFSGATAAKQVGKWTARDSARRATRWQRGRDLAVVRGCSGSLGGSLSGR